MKNLVKFLVPAAVAALALISCNKEDNYKAPDANALHITVTARTEALANEAESKTYIDGTTIKWGTGEYMKIGVFDGTATTFGNSTDESANIWNGDAEAMFNFSISPANASGEYTYYGLYPASAAVATSNTNPASYKVNLPFTQNATASSYDPKAYILVARPEGGKTNANADWEASFLRATALNKITLKNLSEDIKRVTITAPDGTYLAGGRHFDLTATTADNQKGDIYSGGGRTNTVDVKFATPLSGGADMDIWFTSWDAEIAVDAKLTIVAYSATHTFTREITVVNKPITFKEGYLNTLKVNMSSAVQGDNTELDEGNYLVLAKDGTNYYALKAEKESGKERLLSVAYTGSLSSYNGDADLIWTLTKSGGSFIFENDSKYLGYKGSGNESYWLAADENWTETNYLLDVTAQTTAGQYYVTLHSNSEKYLSKNGSGAFFAFYGNTGQKADIVFVPATVDTRADVTLSFDEDVINLTTANYDSFLGQDVAASPNVTAITQHLVWSKVDNDSVIDDFDEGVLTLTGNEGSATVTVAFDGDTNYKPASASYTINVASSSSITLTSTDIDEGSNVAAITVNSLPGYRLGTSKSAGDITIKANNYATISFKAVAWKSSSDSFSITNGTISSASSYSPSANDAATGTINSGASVSISSPISEVTIDVTDSSSDVVITSNKRVILWGFTATTAGPAVTWNLESIAITTPPAKTVYTEGESFDPTGMVVTGHFVDADDNTNTKDEAVTGYTISPDGALATTDTQVTITYQGKSATQNITVNAAATPTYDFETVAELNALVTSSGDSSKNNDAVEYNGKLTSAVVSFVPDASNAIVKDATGSILVYKSSHGLLQGQTFTGDVTVSAKLYYTTVEITAIDASFTGSQSEVLPATMTLSQLEGNFSTYQNAYVKVEGLTVTARDAKNITVSDGAKTYLVYDNANTSTAAVGDVITAIGTVADHNGTNQIKVWASSDITVTSSTPKAITFSQPSQTGCSFTVNVSGVGNITSGTTVASGTSVTLTATAGTDYEFSSWTVNGVTLTDASANPASFTMGTSAVSISANFTSTGGNQQTPTLQYTLTPAATGGNSTPHNSYAAAATTTIDGIEWSVMGNSSMTPWRIGGKNITGVNRPIYSTTAISANISQIVITHGAASNITVNSMTVYVCSTAAGAAADTPTNVVASFTPTFVADGDVTINKADNTSWANCFYRIVYNVTVSGNTNRFVSFNEVKFYGTN